MNNMRKRNNFSSNRNNNNNGGQHNQHNRNRSRRSHGGQGGGQHGNNGHNLVLDGEVINPRQRHNAKNNRDKYLNQARDALSAGDRVKAEYYFQHADHYQRIINLMEEHQAQLQRERGIAEEDDADAAHMDGDDMSENDADMVHAMPSPSQLYAETSYHSASQDEQGDAHGHVESQNNHEASDDYNDREFNQRRAQRRPQHQQQRQFREPRETREPRERAAAQQDLLSDVDVSNEPRERTVVREVRQPRQQRTPRPRVRNEEAEMSADDHGSQLESLLPAPKNSV